MLEYVSINIGKKPTLYDSATRQTIPIDLQRGARSHLRQYVNERDLNVVSIHESVFKNKTQLICWYIRDN